MDTLTLDSFDKCPPRQGPLLLVILDGWGIGKEYEGNAIFQANIPNMRALADECEGRHLIGR